MGHFNNRKRRIVKAEIAAMTDRWTFKSQFQQLLLSNLFKFSRLNYFYDRYYYLEQITLFFDIIFDHISNRRHR